MSDDWKLTISIADGTGNRIGQWSNFEHQNTDGKEIAELYERHAKEAMDQYRHFATLRAFAIWLPIIIVLTAFAYITDNTKGGVSIFLDFTPALLVVFVLAIVFFAQHSLSRIQHKSRIIAHAAQKRAIEALKGNQVPHATYEELVDAAGEGSLKVHTNLKRFKMDSPSRSLLLFYLLIGLTILSVSVYRTSCDFRVYFGVNEGCPGPGAPSLPPQSTS